MQKYLVLASLLGFGFHQAGATDESVPEAEAAAHVIAQDLQESFGLVDDLYADSMGGRLTSERLEELEERRARLEKRLRGVTGGGFGGFDVDTVASLERAGHDRYEEVYRGYNGSEGALRPMR